MPGEIQTLVTTFTARTSAFHAKLKKMQADLVKLQAATAKAGKAIGASFARIGMVAGAGAAASIKVWADFEKQLASVSTMLSGDTGPMMDKFKRQLRTMAVDFGESTSTLSKGLYDILSASVPAEHALGVLEVSAKAASAGMTDTGTAADVLTTLINSYNLEATDAGRVSDLLFNIVKRGKTTFPELAQSIGMVSTSAAKAGLSMEQLGGFYATLTRAGINTQISTTGIRAVLTAFLAPSKQAAEAAKEFGFELSTATLRSKGIVGVLQMLAKVANENPDALAKMFPNVRAITALLPAAANAKAFTEDVRSMAASAGATEEAFEKMKDTVSFAFGKIKQSVVIAFGEVGEGVMDRLNDLGVHVGDFAVRNSESMKRMGAEIGTAIANIVDWFRRNGEVIRDVTAAVISFVGGIMSFMAEYPALLAALIALKITGFMGINAAISSMITLVTTLYTTTIPALWAAFIKSELTLSALIAKFMTFKVVAGGLALGVLAAGVMAANKAFEDFRDTVREGSEALRELHAERVRHLSGKVKEALAMEKGEERNKALAQAQQNVKQELHLAESQVRGYSDALIAARKKVRDLIEEEGTLGDARGLIGIKSGHLVQAEADLVEAEQNLQDAKKRNADAKRLVQETESIVGAETSGGGTAGGGAAAGSGAAGGGAAAGGGGGGRATGPVGDIAEALAGSVADATSRKLEEEFGQAGARAGGELAQFLDMNPTEQQMRAFMANLEGMTQQDIDSAMMVRQQWINAGDTVAATNQAMVQDVAGSLQAKAEREEAARAREAAAQQRVDVANEQQRQGSLMRRMEAEETHGTLESQRFLEASQQRLAVLQGEMTVQSITMAEYQQGLANVNAGFNAGTQFANALAQAEINTAKASAAVQQQVAGAGKRFRDLQKQLYSGGITQAQFSAGVRQLTADMQGATKAARDEAAAERQRTQAMRQRQQAMMRPAGGGGGGGAGGGGGGGGKAHPMDFLLARLSMAQAKAQLLMPNKQAFGRTIAGHRTGDIRKRRQSFAQAMGDVQHIQRLIGNMRMAMMRGPMMATRGFANLDDPGMVTQQQGAVTISLPNVTRVNNEEIGSLSDRLDEYRSRQGRQVV